MVFCLVFIVLHLLHMAQSLIVLQSMEMVSCANKDVCYENKNLRITVTASAIESTAGTGSISGIITGGQTWTDSYGNWELLESINIDIDYHDAVWEYQLEDEGTFFIKTEDYCGPFLTTCDSYDHAVACADKGGWGMALLDGSEYTKYAIENVEKWEANISIQSTHLNLGWEASNIQHSIWEENVEISLASKFDTSSCFQNLSNSYYVVVPSSGYDYYYFTAKQYWQDARNNFNLSVETWERDFDCNYSWVGWHTIIPFYYSDDDYITLSGGNNPRVAMGNDQLYAFRNGYISSHYDEIMDTFSGDCSDDTSFTDSILGSTGPPLDNKYIVSNIGIVEHFELTLDLDYTQFLQMPTQSPTRNPSKSPTPSPTDGPTHDPTTTTTQHPTSPPSQPPTLSPTEAIIDTFAFYEIPAKLEITSSSSINISSEIVQSNIIQSIASGLNYGREYIRLDSAECITTLSSRRLQSMTDNLILGFTVFATTEADQSLYSTKLEETATYHFILASLTRTIPDTLSIFIANEATHCSAGTTPITIAGQQICESICGLNQYYDAASTSCKDQVEFIITTSVTRDTFDRIKYLGIGVFGWIVTLGAIYTSYRCCIKPRNKRKSTKKATKRAIETAVYSIGSTDQESSEFSEDEFTSMKKKFTASLNRAVTRKKRKKKMKPALLSQESESESSSGSEYSTESNTESESETLSQTSTESK